MDLGIFSRGNYYAAVVMLRNKGLKYGIAWKSKT